ncbi:hypothetical protein [Jiangella rhizosphaerae]|uniref:Uncharacterized protein n=1 Tax=Jiangella rhizosphaerae TaxID=2293569 RepID=A0A418KG04_9ACTN|nr:hypothetical protein [Jiangella rhizosphaerae]RIQ10844.1 hypothetical protein DY240_31155 [Jiangella rhizosphaerae]
MTLGDAVANTATRTQHAIRLLVLLRVCGDPTGGSDPVGMVQVIRSERRLQALDFWLRNPDYLADELVTAVEDGHLGDDYLRVAERLLTDPEPAWHHYPMPKWFYGAYEEVDDAFAILQAYGLGLVRRRGVPPKPLRNQFFLTGLGAEKADELVEEDVLSWYPRQAQLVHLVARGDSGTRLKDRQYAQEQYATAVWGTTIGSIREQVLQRLVRPDSRNTSSRSTDVTVEQQ